MRSKEELIDVLTISVRDRFGQPDSLHLLDWDHSCWERVLRDAEVVRFEDGELIMKRDEDQHDLYFLAEGQLEVSVPQRDSFSMSPLTHVGPGSVVGEMAFMDEHSRSASVWSRGHSVLFRLRREAFDNLRRREPELAFDIVFAIGRILAERLRKAQQGINGSSTGSSPFG